MDRKDYWPVKKQHSLLQDKKGRKAFVTITSKRRCSIYHGLKREEVKYGVRPDNLEGKNVYLSGYDLSVHE